MEALRSVMHRALGSEAKKREKLAGGESRVVPQRSPKLGLSRAQATQLSDDIDSVC